MSPANFPLINPVVLERTLETHGENLVKGMEHLPRDLERGQLTHTDASAFKLGENIACTPGKVVHETAAVPADPVLARHRRSARRCRW